MWKIFISRSTLGGRFLIFRSGYQQLEEQTRELEPRNKNPQLHFIQRLFSPFSATVLVGKGFIFFQIYIFQFPWWFLGPWIMVPMERFWGESEARLIFNLWLNLFVLISCNDCVIVHYYCDKLFDANKVDTNYTNLIVYSLIVVSSLQC